MKRKGNLILDVRMVPSLESAIDQWLAARDGRQLEVPVNDKQNSRCNDN